MDGIIIAVELMLTVPIGAFALGAVVLFAHEWREVSPRFPMVAFASFAALLWLAVFLDAMRRVFGLYWLNWLADLGIVAAIFISAYAVVRVMNDSWAHGKPLRAGIVIGTLCFAIFSFGLAPLAVLVASNPSNLMTTFSITEAFSLAMAGIVGWAIGRQPGLRT